MAAVDVGGAPVVDHYGQWVAYWTLDDIAAVFGMPPWGWLPSDTDRQRIGLLASILDRQLQAVEKAERDARAKQRG